MIKSKTFADKVISFNEELSKSYPKLPDGYNIINPFNGDQKELVKQVSNSFYQKYYTDTAPRRLILGSSPARRGTAVTGVPFEDAAHLQNITGIFIDKFYINKSSSGFLYDVMEEYGGCDRFYANFYMNFVCPLGIVRTNSKGKEVNCNYYENKKLQESLYPFILDTIRTQIQLGIDTSVCYCIGSGENYTFLDKMNNEFNFFEKIIPLEHPRFIMQYNSNKKEIFLEKYIDAFKE